MSSLILKRASVSRSGGEWKDDDYDVLADGVVVGRIFNAVGVAGRIAMDVDAGLRPPRGPIANARVRSDSRNAMAAFARSWRRE